MLATKFVCSSSGAGGSLRLASKRRSQSEPCISAYSLLVFLATSCYEPLLIDNLHNICCLANDTSAVLSRSPFTRNVSICTCAPRIRDVKAKVHATRSFIARLGTPNTTDTADAGDRIVRRGKMELMEAGASDAGARLEEVQYSMHQSMITAGVREDVMIVVVKPTSG
ncbi:hypothetical protein MRB53_037091 [Persea americana]|nr:hypothetical protein MRB53_037091 [Persea americana]